MPPNSIDAPCFGKQKTVAVIEIEQSETVNDNVVQSLVCSKEIKNNLSQHSNEEAWLFDDALKLIGKSFVKQCSLFLLK